MAAAGSLLLIVHELSTNAIKYGALSDAEGSVAVTLNVEFPGDGSAPQQQGLGARLMRRGLAGQGHAEFEFLAEGLHCRIEASW